jgi:TRAP-type C4-dicarboxylate transport system permease small subunit
MFGRTVRFLNKGTEVLTILLLSIMVLLIFWQICSRVLFHTSFSWTEELARYLMVWVAFLGAGFAFQYGAHISIESFVKRFSPKYKKIFQTLIAIVCILFFSVLIIYGLELVTDSMTQTSTALKIPMGFVFLAIPISGVLQILNVIDITFRFIKYNEQIGID